MTVSSQTSTETFFGNGVTTTWPLPFRFFQNSDIQASLVDPATQTSTPLVLGTDYTLTGAGLPEQFGTAPGTITTVVPVANGKELYVERVMAVEQLTDIINQGEFFPEIHEDVFDRVVMLIQQGNAGLARALLRPVGKNYYDAEGRQIKSLADPTEPQDAATMLWAQQYVGSVIQAGTGSMNNAGNVVYVSPGLVPYTVQDMSDTTDMNKGAALIGRAVVSIRSINQLLISPQQSHLLFVTSSYRDGLRKGGASYQWSASTPKSSHNGIDVISPTVPLASDYSNLLAFLSGTGETMPAGNGCFLLIYPTEVTAYHAGLIGDGTTDESALAQKFVDLRKGKVCAFAGRHVVAGLILDGQTYNNTTINVLEGGELIVGPRPTSSSANFLLSWVGLGIRDCDGVTLNYRGHGNRANQPDQEHVFMVRLAGVTNFKCPLFKAREMRGDGIYIGQKEHSTSSTTSSDLKFGYFECENSADDGRNAMSIIAGANIQIDTFRSIRIGGLVGGFRQPGGFDIEPNLDFQTVTDVRIGEAYIRTAGNRGLAAYGRLPSALGGNVDGFTVDYYYVENTCPDDSVTVVNLDHLKNVEIKGVVKMTRNAAYTACSALLIDNAQNVTVDQVSSGGTYGARIGMLDRAVDVDLNLRHSDYQYAACQTTYVTRSKISVRARGGQAGSRALYTRKMARSGVNQDNVTYIIDCPAAGTSGTVGAFNETADLMTFTNCRMIQSDLTGYASNNARMTGFGAGFSRVNNQGVNYSTSMPTDGTWAAADVVNRSTPALIGASNMTLIGWIRLTDGAGNVSGTDWANMYVSHVQPAT